MDATRDLVAGEPEHAHGSLRGWRPTVAGDDLTAGERGVQQQAESSDGWSAAFLDLYRQRYDPMVRLAFLLTSDDAAAEELVQDVFVRISGRLDHVDRPSAYLRTAVVNACRSYHRRRQLERLLPRPRERHVEPPTHDDLRPLLDALPPRQRTALVLRFYEDMKVDDIAAAMGTRPGTVKSLIHRGVAALREEVAR